MDLKKLYKPYEGTATLEQTIGWLEKQALSLGIRPDIVQKTLNDTFLEMEGGKKFSTDGSEIGFNGVKNAVLNRYMLEKMILFHSVATEAYNKATEGFLQKRIDTAIRDKGKRLNRFLNCNNSWILKKLRIV